MSSRWLAEYPIVLELWCASWVGLIAAGWCLLVKVRGGGGGGGEERRGEEVEVVFEVGLFAHLEQAQRLVSDLTPDDPQNGNQTVEHNKNNTKIVYDPR